MKPNGHAIAIGRQDTESPATVRRVGDEQQFIGLFRVARLSEALDDLRGGNACPSSRAPL